LQGRDLSLTGPLKKYRLTEDLLQLPQRSADGVTHEESLVWLGASLRCRTHRLDFRGERFWAKWSRSRSGNKDPEHRKSTNSINGISSVNSVNSVNTCTNHLSFTQVSLNEVSLIEAVVGEVVVGETRESTSASPGTNNLDLYDHDHDNRVDRFSSVGDWFGFSLVR
jgi:hypothetical protein